MLIRKLAVRRTVATAAPVVKYEATEAVSFILEHGRWVPSFESGLLTETKKADMETGEDQKGQ